MIGLLERIDHQASRLEVDTDRRLAEIVGLRQESESTPIFADRNAREIENHKQAVTQNRQFVATVKEKRRLPGGIDDVPRLMELPGMQTDVADCYLAGRIDHENSLRKLQPQFEVSDAELHVDIGDSGSRPPSWTGPPNTAEIATVWGG